MKARIAGIIPMKNGIALMHRKDVQRRDDFNEYYVFPGGGLEENETLEEGAKREIKEEFGIEVEVEKLLYEMDSEKFNRKEYFFLCKYISGEFGTGTGPEFSGDPKYIESGKYFPEIIKKDEIKNLFLLPSEIKEKLIDDIEKGNI